MSTPRKSTPGQISRRNFLRRTGFGLPAAFAGASLAGCGSSSRSDGGRRGGGDGENVFRHGVASGDPLFDRVIVWTRVTTTTATNAVPVTLEMARDPAFENVVISRNALAAPERDYTVKLDVAGLNPGTIYYYRFAAAGFQSPVGRTRTADVGTLSRLRMGVVSCSSLAHGFFNAYRLLARRNDLDVVLHLGDYIYEYGNNEYGSLREYEPPTETLTLEDYRTRYGQYRSDPDCAELHRQHPMIAVWDDHETTDNSWRDNAKNHTEMTETEIGEGCWTLRKAWAIQAYREWMPIRDNLADYIAPESCTDTRDPARVAAQERIFRRFAFGDLVDLVMLDARLFGRDIPRRPNVVPAESADTESGNTENDVQDAGLFANCAAPFDGDYSNLGREQTDWFLGELRSSNARWRLVGQQMMFGQLQVLGLPRATCTLPNTGDVLALLETTPPDGPLAQVLAGVANQLPLVSASSLFLNADQWDGYPGVRDEILEAIGNDGIDNVVVLTGDIHTSWAIDLTPDPNNPVTYNPVSGEGSRAVEFVCTSVTSPGLEALDGIADALRLNNPHMKYIDLAQRGYMVFDITPERCQGEWYHIDSIEMPGVDGERFAAAFFTVDGGNRMQMAAGPTVPPSDAMPPAP